MGWISVAESFVEKRKRELGLTSSPSKTKSGSPDKDSDFVTKRKMDLGLIPDTREKKPEPYQGKAQPLQPMGQGYEEAEPSLLQKTGNFIGKGIAESFDPIVKPASAIVKGLVESYNRPSELKPSRTDYPDIGIFANPLNILGEIANTKVAQGISNIGRDNSVPGLSALNIAAPAVKAAAPSYKGLSLGANTGNALKAAVKVNKDTVKPILGLPAGRPRGNVNTAQTPDTIFGQGDIYTPEPLGLPQGNYVKPTRLKVNNAEHTLDQVMTKIKPEVESLISVPKRRDELVTYIHRNTQIPINEIHNMPIVSLQELGQEIRKSINVYDVAVQTAKNKGYDLPKLLEGQASSIKGKRAMDASARVAGVYPDSLPKVQTPILNKQVFGKVDAPVEKVGFKQSDVTVIAPKTRFAPVKSLGTESTKTIESFVERRKKELGLTDVTKPEIPASAKESAATLERGFYKNIEKNGDFSDQLNQGLKTTDKTYERLTNVETVAKANENVKNLTAAEAQFLGNEVLSAEHVATGQRLMQQLDSMGEHERALNVANKLAADLTKSGQTSQAAAILKRLSPEGQLLNLVRTATKSGKTVTVEDSEVYKNLAKEAQKAGLTGERSSQVMEIFDRAKAGETISEEDHKVLDELLKDVRVYVKSKDGKTLKEAKLPKKLEEKKIRDQVLSVLEEQEKKVLERMRARGNRLSSTPFDVYADYALLGSIKLAKGAISFSKWSEQMIKDAGEDIRPHLATIYEKAQRMLEDTTNKISETKVINAEKVAEKFIKEGKITPQDEEMLRNLSKQLHELSESKSIQADMQMQQILNSYQKVDFGGKVATLRYMAMLLNTSTQSVNAMSGPIMMTYNHMLDVIATPFDIIYSGMFKTQRNVTFKQGPGLADNLFEPVKDWFKGLKVGGKAGWEGVDPEGIATQHDIRGLSFPSKVNPLGLTERTIGAVAKAPDYATFSATKKMELRKIAYLDALNKGVKGKEAIRNYMDKFISNPDPKALEQAARVGKKTTFQFTEGFAGKAANAARNINNLTGSKDLGIANAVLPFIRTPVNMAIVGVENTPAGIVKGLFEINRLRAGSDIISKREIIKTFTSATAGGTGVLGGLGFILAGLGIVTGDYSSQSRDVQNIQDAVGEGKFRFNTTAFGRMFDALTSGNVDNLKEVSQYRKGDHQFDYNKLQPLAFPFAAGATFSDQQKMAGQAGARGEAYPLSKQLGESGKSAAASLFGMSSLQGLTNTFRTKPGATGADIPIQIAQNIGESFIKGFSPSLVAQEARRQDHIQRETAFNQSFGEDVGSYFKSRTPGLSQSLPPKITNLGDTKKNFPGVAGNYLNPLRSEKTQYNEAAQVLMELIQRTGNEELAPKPMDKSVTGKNSEGMSTTVKLTPARYAKLQEDVGKQIAKLILELPKLMSDEEMSFRVEKIYEVIRGIERNKVKEELKLH